MPKFSLKKLLKKPSKKKKDGDPRVTDLSDLPKLREADSHPDAPARRPIFAEEDLGSPLASKIKPFEEQQAQEAQEAQEALLNSAAPDEEIAAPEVRPAPFVAEKSLHAEPVAEPEVPVAQPSADISEMVTPPPAAPEPASQQPQFAPPAEQVAPPTEPVSVSVEAPSVPETAIVVEEPVEPKEDLSGLSIAELADRLENGLARLKQLEIASRSAAQPATVAPAENTAGSITIESEEAPMTVPPLKPVEKTEEEVQAARQADMDAALKAALGTLEKMTAQR